MHPNWANVLWAAALLLSSTLAAPRTPAGALAAPSAPLTFTVNNVFDVPANFSNDPGFTVCHTSSSNNICTLRAAIMNANRHAGGATIILPSQNYVLTLVPMGADDDASGDLNITGTVSLVGAGAAGTVVDGGGLDKVFTVRDHSLVVISGLTVRNGDGGSNGSGGGLDNFGNLTLSDSTISDNHAGLGGGLFNEQDATLLVRRSTIADNKATLNSGGGIENVGTLTVENSTVSNNRAVVGGGLSTRSASTGTPGSLTVVNSTVSNNSATGTGGGVFAASPATFYHTTIAGNLADSGRAGGGYGGGVYGAMIGQVHVWNSLFAFNYQAEDDSTCSGAGLTSDDYNDFQTTSSCTITNLGAHDITNDPAPLWPLADNGGATQTRALLSDSNAVDTIPPARCRDQFGAAPVPDQRGVARPVNGLCDMGAFEGQQTLTFYFTNLALNGDAEGAAGSPAGALVGTPYWTPEMGGLTVVPYGSPGGFPAAPPNNEHSLHNKNFFAGGAATDSRSFLYLSLNGIASAVDTGDVHFTLSADLGGFETQADNASFSLIFYDKDSTPIGLPVTIGPVTPAERGYVTVLVHKSTTALVPVGARQMQVVLEMFAVSGYNDGYADNLSLVLTPPYALWGPVARR